MKGQWKALTAPACAAVMSLAVTLPANASLMLNSTGTSLGFTLTTFVSGYSAQYGPLSQGNLSNGNIITGSRLGTQIYVFSDVDGQTLADAISSTPYTCQTGNCNFAMATAGGQVYGAQAQGGTFLQFANDGSSTPIPNLQAAGLTDNLGMWGDPVNGHLIASTNLGLANIDPVAGTYSLIVPGLFPDGVTVSPDGLTAYVEVGGAIRAYSIVTGMLLATYSVGHSPDGTGVISGGNLDGDVIVNNNDGTVGLLDPSQPNGSPTQYQIIATGGTRGDFVSPDANNGTLFLAQNEQVARLSCGPGCSIGSTGPGDTPEPGTLALSAIACAGLILVRRRPRRV
jgi:hypothetical protein